jgi:hypothetical protein
MDVGRLVIFAAVEKEAVAVEAKDRGHEDLCVEASKALSRAKILGISPKSLDEQSEDVMTDLTKTIIERGDLAHLALFLWASGASALLVWSLKEMAQVNRHFNDFVREIAALNQLFRKED